MKKNTLSIVLISSALLCNFIINTACNKGKTNSTQKTEQLVTGNLSFEVPVLSKNGEFDSITVFIFKTNMDSLVKSFDSKYTVSNIQTVKLKSCILSINNGDSNNNFRNFHTTNVGITSGSNWSIHRMAAATDIQDTNAYNLNVPTSYDPNLASYFKSDSICYRFYGNVRRATTIPLNCKATLTYDMTISR